MPLDALRIKLVIAVTAVSTSKQSPTVTENGRFSTSVSPSTSWCNCSDLDD